MSEQYNTKSSILGTISYRKYFYTIFIFWSFFIAVLIVWNVFSNNESVYNKMTLFAEGLVNKDIMYRKWSSWHGGVYVPVSEETKPNAFLNPYERDIKTPNNKVLTLINPDYMTRQVYDIQKRELNIISHLSGLNPLNPENKSDEWEAFALTKFNDSSISDKSIHTIETIGSVEYFRLIKPIYTEENCVSCHTENYNDIGAILGGISVSIPTDDYYDSTITANWIQTGVLVAIWLGVALILYRNFNRLQVLEAERQKAIQENEYARKLAEEATLSKSKFIANMSHEIRTPMNAIQGFADLIQEKDIDEETREYLSAIKISSNTLLDLINDILDISKIEVGKLDLKYAPVDIRTIFAEMKKIFLQAVDAKDIELLFEIDEDVPQYLYLDKIRVRQILLNLIGNAVKFTHEGHVKVSVEYKKNLLDKENKIDLIISVEDTGIGIPSDQLDTIFEAFEQQKDQSISDYGGTGLGLTITESLIRLMNGKISVKSRKGKGSVFTVLLPQVKMTSLPELQDEIFDALNSEIVFHNYKVLIVDDFHLNRVLIKKYLADKNLEFIEAADGKEAVEQALNKMPDLILMDMKMPVMDGYEATEIIKKSDLTKHIPVIACTAAGMKDEDAKLEQLKIDGYIRKPFKSEFLLKELAKFLVYTVNDKKKKLNNNNVVKETYKAAILV